MFKLGTMAKIIKKNYTTLALIQECVFLNRPNEKLDVYR